MRGSSQNQLAEQINSQILGCKIYKPHGEICSVLSKKRSTKNVQLAHLLVCISGRSGWCLGFLFSTGSFPNFLWFWFPLNGLTNALNQTRVIPTPWFPWWRINWHFSWPGFNSGLQPHSFSPSDSRYVHVLNSDFSFPSLCGCNFVATHEWQPDFRDPWLQLCTAVDLWLWPLSLKKCSLHETALFPTMKHNFAWFWRIHLSVIRQSELHFSFQH